MLKKTAAPLAPWPRHHYLSKPRGGGGAGGCRIQGPGPPPPPMTPAADWARAKIRLVKFLRQLGESKALLEGPAALIQSLSEKVHQLFEASVKRPLCLLCP